jgi:hypothetical protein
MRLVGAIDGIVPRCCPSWSEGIRTGYALGAHFRSSLATLYRRFAATPSRRDCTVPEAIYQVPEFDVGGCFLVVKFPAATP